MAGAQATDDIVTLALIGIMVLLAGVPAVLVVAWRITRPPPGTQSFRRLYAVWASLLASSSVWNLSRDVRFSAAEAGADNFLRLGFLCLGVLLILSYGASSRFAFVSELTRGPLGFFSALAAWGAATTLWSVSPAGTLYKSFEYCAMLAVFGLTVWSITRNVADARGRLWALKGVFDFGWFLLVLLILSVYAGIPIWPEYAFMRGYRDEMGLVGFSVQGALPGQSANGVGQIAAILGVVALVRTMLRPRTGLFWVPVFAVSLVTMVLTQSRSPVLAFAVAVAAVLIANRRFLALAALGAPLFVVVVSRYAHLAYEFMRRGQNDKDLFSLTGRVEYWQSSIEALRESPVGGFGANVGGRYILKDVLGETDVSTVHSMWVELLVDTGAVGLVIFVAALGATWWWMLRLRRRAGATIAGRSLWLESLGVLTVLCVRSVFDVSFVWSSSVLTFGLVLVFIGVMRREDARNPAGQHLDAAQPLPATRRGRRGISV